MRVDVHTVYGVHMLLDKSVHTRTCMHLVYTPIPRFCLHAHSLLCEMLLSSTPAARDALPRTAKQYTDYFLGLSGI